MGRQWASKTREAAVRKTERLSSLIGDMYDTALDSAMARFARQPSGVGGM